jgi:chromate reductase
VVLVEWEGLAGPCPPSTRTSSPRRRSQSRTSSTPSRRPDALLDRDPEYNASLPGALKNALDWAVAPFPDNV